MDVEFTVDFIADPHSAYARLREQGPVHRAVTKDGPCWLITSYPEARRALADSRLSLDKANSTTGYRGFSLPPALDANLLNMDPPAHTRLRRLIAKAFTPRRAEQMRPRITEIAEQLADSLAGQEETDLLETFAGPLPIIVICELLGVPEGDRPDFRAWTDVLLVGDPARPEASGQALRALHGYLVELVAAKRAEPGDDLLSTLIALRDGEAKLSEDELTSAAFLVLFAGYENTVNLLGNGVVALLSESGQLTTLRNDLSMLPGAVDELLRFDPPPQLAIRRFALVDMDIGGARIAAGDTVLVALASAHRDGETFVAADELDLARSDNPHLGFGHGPHYCLGAALARAEVEIGLETLLRRFPHLALAVPPGELHWRQSARNRGLSALPVTLAR